jgi:site-specific recombinase XerD
MKLSKLSELITQYVTLKQSMGNKFKTREYILRAFCRTVGDSVDIKEVTKEQVACFLGTSSQITRYWHDKYNALAGFYKYAISRGYVRSSPLPTTIPKLPQPFVPYIYTHDELRRLLDATTSYRKQTRRDKLEPHTFRAILLLLYGAGLRISEALSLTLADVDLVGAVLTIRNTKFNKTRFVPLGPQLNQAMVQYLMRRRQDHHSQAVNMPFFVGRTGLGVSINTVQKAFNHLLTHAEIYRTDNARYQPRLQDLRHAFAVHRLTQWYREGKDVQRLLPRLATYMGHIELSSTQVYLTMTPQLLQEASRRFEQYAIKEASHDR